MMMTIGLDDNDDNWWSGVKVGAAQVNYHHYHHWSLMIMIIDDFDDTIDDNNHCNDFDVSDIDDNNHWWFWCQ